MTTVPSVVGAWLSLRVGVPKVQPVGAVGVAGSLTTQVVPVGMPPIVVFAPAARLTVPSWAVPSLQS